MYHIRTFLYTHRKGALGTDETEALRVELVGYIRKKFRTRRNICDIADEIVNGVFAEVIASPGFRDEYMNFGYLSRASIRTAYKVFHRNDRNESATVSFELAEPLIGEDGFVDEIERAEDTAAILKSLDTLKQIERIIIDERYYGDFTFREISERHCINLNTVLSHHRRALNKLRPLLSPLYFKT